MHSTQCSDRFKTGMLIRIFSILHEPIYKTRFQVASLDSSFRRRPGGPEFTVRLLSVRFIRSDQVKAAPKKFTPASTCQMKFKVIATSWIFGAVLRVALSPFTAMLPKASTV